MSKELDFFKGIWRSRPHRSEISGQLILNFSPVNFSHVLTKGSRPDLRLNDLNIVLMTFQEHQNWEFHAHKLIDKPEWKWVFLLKDYLKSR